MTPLLPVFDLSTPDGCNALSLQIERLRPPVGHDTETARSVAAILNDVRAHGDEAVARHMRKWTDPAFDQSRILVSQAELDDAATSLEPALLEYHAADVVVGTPHGLDYIR